jgi:hypothetical protein
MGKGPQAVKSEWREVPDRAAKYGVNKTGYGGNTTFECKIIKSNLNYY